MNSIDYLTTMAYVSDVVRRTDDGAYANVFADLERMLMELDGLSQRVDAEGYAVEVRLMSRRYVMESGALTDVLRDYQLRGFAKDERVHVASVIGSAIESYVAILNGLSDECTTFKAIDDAGDEALSAMRPSIVTMYDELAESVGALIDNLRAMEGELA